MSGVQVALFPDSDTVVHLHQADDTGRRIVTIRVHDTNGLQFHDLPDAFAWLAKVTADLYVAAYPDDVIGRRIAEAEAGQVDRVDMDALRAEIADLDERYPDEVQ